VPSRRATRVPAHAVTQVGFVGPDQKFTSPLLDFSPFGLSVETAREVKKGAIFRLGIQVGTDYFRAAAISHAQIPDRLAVEFLAMSPIDREMVRHLYLRLQIAARGTNPT
jgi:PilZ domain